MQTTAYKKLVPTHILPNPTRYVELLQGEFATWAFDQEHAEKMKGQWREQAFKSDVNSLLDLEIGTGNGYHFAHYAKANSNRNIVGLEITYKTLIQTIKRAVAQGSVNMRMARYHASQIESIFAPNELNNVFVHFPDPWPKKKHAKNRLFQKEFIDSIYQIQKPGSFLEFKTDSQDYFEWSLEKFKESQYKITRFTNDLHASEWGHENFMTHFEKLWTSKGLKTHMIRLEK